MQHLFCDIAVIGSGLAGLCAALACGQKNLGVMVCSKSKPGSGSCTSISQGHFRTSAQGFSPEDHTNLSLEAGQGLNRKHALNLLVQQAEPTIRELGKLGVPLQKRAKGFDSSPDRIGLEGVSITKPLVRQARSIGVSFISSFHAWRIVTIDNRVVGVLGFHGQEGQPVFVQAKAVILATGGAGALYARTDNPQSMTGSGCALAYHASLPLMDMEFVQFYPLCLAAKSRTSRLLPPVLAEIGTLTNAQMENIADKYEIQRRPLAIAARDELCQAMILEVAEGRGCKGTIALRISTDDQVWRQAGQTLGMPDLSQLQEWVKAKLAHRDFFPVLPAAHFTMGGVVIDEHCQTGLPGLLAAGEVVGGLHGANRYGGNALSEAAVFGKIAGESAAQAAVGLKDPGIHSRPALDWCREQLMGLNRGNGHKPVPKSQDLKRQLQDLMWQEAGVIRSVQSLQRALDGLLSLKAAPGPPQTRGKGLISHLEVMDSILVAETIVRSALFRQESRGAHFRTDFPGMSQEWTGHVLISKNGMQFQPGTK
ncbi:MAG: FAD-binding protein [Desulfovermiculus sp.]